LFNHLPRVLGCRGARAPRTLADVDSMSLTPGQLAKLRADIAPQAEYLQRLTPRMARQQFSTQDEMRPIGWVIFV
jgi:hypothetical protein